LWDYGTVKTFLTSVYSQTETFVRHSPDIVLKDSDHYRKGLSFSDLFFRNVMSSTSFPTHPPHHPPSFVTPFLYPPHAELMPFLVSHLSDPKGDYAKIMIDIQDFRH